MKQLTVLLIAAMAGGAQAAPEGEGPSAEGYFQHATMDKYCRPGSTTQNPALEAYRLHTIEYYRLSAKGASPKVADGAAKAIQQLEANEIPAPISEKFNKIFAKFTPAQHDQLCQNLPFLIESQVAMEKLRIARDQTGRTQ